jgi:glucose/arabinose dehydrogenase
VIPTAAPAGATPPARAATPTGAARAAFDPARVTLALREVASGFSTPLYLTHAGDGSGRVFVVEKAGTIRTSPDRETYLDITDRVGSEGSEQGLLGLAFHPGFRQNRRFYVNYTDRDGNTVVSRFTAGPDGGPADPGSEQVVLRQEQPAANHNGGMLAFGPDGYLYIGLGDGGGGGDTYGNGQNPNTLLAKILRIDVDRGEPYAVPRDNPFVGREEFRPETWAWGLRNPWRFSFDRETGDLYIGDVGQSEYEWVLHQPAGRGGQNYGWPIIEGGECYREDPCDKTGLTLPVAVYTHDEGIAVTGGYVYRGERYPALRGAYVFGDFGDGRIWTLHRNAGGEWTRTEALRADAAISSFGEDEGGELYLTDYTSGSVYQVTAEPR